MGPRGIKEEYVRGKLKGEQKGGDCKGAPIRGGEGHKRKKKGADVEGCFKVECG